MKIDWDDFYRRMEQTMIGLGMDVVEEMQLTCPVASSFLRDNISFDVKRVGSNIELTISIPEYAKFVEWGTLPHMPPVEAIRDWLRVKGMPQELAWAVAMAIKKNGTRPQPFIRPIFNNKIPELFKKNLSRSFQ